MLRLMQSVARSMQSCRRTLPIPHDFEAALARENIVLHKLLPLLQPPVAPPSVCQPRLLEPPEDPLAARLSGGGGTVPTASATAAGAAGSAALQIDNNAQRPAYMAAPMFPPLPSRHTYIFTPAVISIDRDAERAQWDPTAERRMAEKALFGLISATTTSLPKYFSFAAPSTTTGAGIAATAAAKTGTEASTTHSSARGGGGGGGAVAGTKRSRRQVLELSWLDAMEGMMKNRSSSNSSSSSHPSLNAAGATHGGGQQAKRTKGTGGGGGGGGSGAADTDGAAELKIGRIVNWEEQFFRPEAYSGSSTLAGQKRRQAHAKARETRRRRRRQRRRSAHRSTDRHDEDNKR